MNMSFEEFKEKMRLMEIYRHARTMTELMISGQSTDVEMAANREMMATINDDQKMLAAYANYMSNR